MRSIPKCSCGAHNWKQGGGRFSIIIQETYYKYNICHKTGLSISRNGYPVFLILNHASHESALEYINGHLLEMANAYGEEAKDLRDKLEDREIGEFLKSVGVDPSNGCQYEVVKDENGKPILFPSDRWKSGDYHYEYQDNDGNSLDVDQEILRKEVRKIFDKYNIFCGKLLTPPMSHYLPHYMIGYLWKDDGWREIDNERF